MISEEDWEKFNSEIKPNGRYAQILIKIDYSTICEKEIEKIIQSLKINIVSKIKLSKDCILYKLNEKDMREAVLKLTEHGFIVKGINASFFK